MLFFTLISFAAYAFLLILLARSGFRNARPVLISFVALLVIQTIMRQLIFFTDLDLPFPQSHFHIREWTLITIANFALILWLSIVWISYNASGPFARALSGILPQGVPKPEQGKIYGVPLIVLVPALIGLMGTLFLIAQSGGIAQFIYATKVGKELKGLFVFRAAANLGAMLAIFGMLASMKTLPSGARRFTSASYFYMAIMLAGMLLNYLWGNRYNLALMILVLGLAWHFYVHRISLFRAIILGAGAMAFLAFLRLVRRTLTVSALAGSTQDTAITNLWLEVSQSLHFVEFDALMLALRDTGNLFEIRYGKDFLNGLLSWVPRSIYPDKETFHIGSWFRRIYQPGIINGWPVTTPGGWYVNFGWFGLILGGTISGFAIRMFDEAYRDVRNNPWHAAIGFGLAFFLFEGGVNTGFPQGIFLLVIPIGLASLYLRTQNTRRRQAHMRPGSPSQPLRPHP